MSKNVEDFKKLLPEQCQALTIKPRHKMALAHYRIGNDMWVIHLTEMPGKRCQAWKMTADQYWQTQPKYGYRDDFFRHYVPPTLEGAVNPEKPRQLMLLLL